MSKFEEYQEKKKQNQNMYEFYRSRRDEALDSDRMPYLSFDGGNEFEEKIEKRLKNSTFMERTEYYFNDTELMKQKVMRYYQLSGDSSDPEENRAAEVEAFARKYNTGRWARKRKSAAMNAAIKFEKVVQLQEELKNAANLTPYQLFEKREKIMRLRMAGMLEAAKVKSESSAHETYLKNKAKVSCLSIISDQLESLWVQTERTGDLDQRDKFMSKHEAIEKELLQAKRSLRTSAGSFENKWLEKNKSPFDAFGEAAQPTIQKELNLLNRDSIALSFPLRIQLKGKDAKPISARDKEADEWNQKYREAEADNDIETQKSMIMDEIKFMMEYPMPSASEVKGSGAVHFLKRDFQGLYRMMKKTAPAILVIAGQEAGDVRLSEQLKSQMAEYLKDKLDIVAKATAFIKLGYILDNELEARYKLIPDKNGDYLFDPTIKESRMELYFVTEYGEQLQELAEEKETFPKEKELSIEEERVKLLKINEDLDDGMHQMYRRINKTVDKKITAEKLANEAIKDLGNLFSNFQFPSTAEINGGNWLENALSNNVGATLKVLGKAKALVDVARNWAVLMQYEDEHPDFTARLNCAAQLAVMCRNYLKYFYSIDVGDYLNGCQMLSPRTDDEKSPDAQKVIISKFKYARWNECVSLYKTDEEKILSEYNYEKQLEEEQKANKSDRFNYDYFKAAKESNRVVFHPKFKARIRYAWLKKMLGEGNVFKYDQYFNIYDTAGAMLKSVKYDKDLNPVSFEEQQKHDWNEKWTRAILDDDKDTIARMSMEGIDDIFSMELPGIDDLRVNGWIEKQLSKNPEKLFETLRRASGLPSLIMEVPQLRKYIKDRPALGKKMELLLYLRDCVHEYMNGVLGAGFDFRVSSKNDVKKNEMLSVYFRTLASKDGIVAPTPRYEKSMFDYLAEYDKYLDIKRRDRLTARYEKKLKNDKNKNIFGEEIKKNEKPFSGQEMSIEGIEGELNNLEEPIPIIEAEDEILPTEEIMEDIFEFRIPDEEAVVDNMYIPGEILEEEEKKEEKKEVKKEVRKENRIVHEDLRTFKQVREEEENKIIQDGRDDLVRSYPLRQTRYTKASLKNANIKKTYEKQAYASNDCWSCAGPAILNHLLQDEKGYKNVTQQEFRGYEPKFASAKDMGLEEEVVNEQKVEIMAFTTLNDAQDRKDSYMGNPYLIADFYLEKLAKYPAHKNTAVRKAVFQVGKAIMHKNGLVINTEKDGKIVEQQYMGKNPAALHNLQEQFRDTVTAAINRNEAISMYYHGHYYVITDINGDTLMVCDSLPKFGAKTLDIRDIIGDTDNSDPAHRPVELVWLDKIEDPKELSKEFKELKYDEKTGAFSTGQKRYSESVAHILGVDVVKEPEEMQEDVASYMQESIYVPKTYTRQ